MEAMRAPLLSAVLLLAALTLAATVAAASPPPAVAWRAVVPGAEYAELDGAPGDPVRFHVVRVDPAVARLRAVMATAAGGERRTAGAWCEREQLAAAINLGMFLDDGLRNVGHAHSGGHVNHATWVGKYQSVLAFGPRRRGVPAARIVDLDTPGAKESLADYDTVVQNLRLIKAPAQNAWKPQPRRWSEAAVAVDARGRVLFVFVRAPLSMFEFNRRLLALPLDVTAAMHVEGGPEASLSLRAPGLHMDLDGSYETGFNENEDQHQQWPLPNVLGVEATKSGGKRGR